MKYLQLERILQKHGCEYLHDSPSGYPIWRSPVSGKKFRLSSVRSREIGYGVLVSILKAAGLNPLLANENKKK